MLSQPQNTDNIDVAPAQPAPPSLALRASTMLAAVLGVLILITLAAFGYMLFNRMAEKKESGPRSTMIAPRVRAPPIRLAWPAGSHLDQYQVAGDRAIIRLSTPNKGSAIWIVNLSDGRMIAEYGDVVSAAVPSP